MTKGKKQQSTAIDCDNSVRSSTLMSDEGYAHFGSLGGQGEFAREWVVVDPRVPSRGRLGISQTPLGRMPRPLLSVFGLENALVDLFLRNAQPRCSRCGVGTNRSESLDHGRWPSDGYVAVVVDGVEESISLEQQCELLGVERAVIEGRLVRAEEVDGRQGEPVLTIAPASDMTHVAREVERWIARGGGPVRLMHYLSRSERGVEIQKVFREWRCATCGDSYPIATPQRIDDAPPCQRCRGEGWLLVEDDRFLACEGCDAFGRASPLARYEVAGAQLKDTSRLTFQAVRDYLKHINDNGTHDLAERIEGICDEGFAPYPIGAPGAFLSKGERVLATVTSARLSGISDLELVVDAGGLGASAPWIDALVSRSHAPRLRVVRPTTCEATASREPRLGERVCTVRDVIRGPLSISTLSFDVGGLTAVQGEPGVGKSLLLQEIARRFGKRKKLSHLGAFGDIKRCHYIYSDSHEDHTVMELLGVAAHVAEQASRSRHARERGLEKGDFLLSRSPHRCERCKGAPSVAGARCSACDGSLCDRIVGSVEVATVPFAELVQSSLDRAATVMWSDDAVSAVLERVPEELRRTLLLGGSARALSPALRRFLATLGPLAAILAGKGKLDGELVLVDLPFGTTAAYQHALIQCINELHTRGATIVCAGVPETLENIFSSVVRLQFVEKPVRDHQAERYLDVRMTRKSEVVVER